MATSTTTKTVKAALPDDIFAVNVSNHELVKLAYDSYLANSRTASATTKQRGEVSGGGKKPWKQKGTGRARFGSSRNPIWRGGGIVFGPRGNENYSKSLTKTSKRVAVKQALTLANVAGKVIVKDITVTGKTADFVKYLSENELTGKVLIVVNEKTNDLMRSTNNIQNVLVTRTSYLNVFNILNADKIVLATDTIDTLKSWLTHSTSLRTESRTEK